MCRLLLALGLLLVFLGCDTGEVSGPVSRQPAPDEGAGESANRDGPAIWTWVEPGKVAGSPAPEKFGPLAAWADALAADAGRPLVVINLQVAPDGDYGEAVVTSRHLPVPDFQPPTVIQAEEAAAFIQAHVDQGRAAVVHCSGGCGRTGTILAAWLIRARGLSAPEAIALLRSKRACYVETAGQEAFLEQFADL